jgi:hypothetical protein
VASALAARVIEAGRGAAHDRVALAVEAETAMAALERVALAVDRGEDPDLGRTLLVRYGVQQAVERVAMQAAALAGGLAFISSSDVAYLLAAARALAYHPPSTAVATDALDGYLAGNPISLIDQGLPIGLLVRVRGDRRPLDDAGTAHQNRGVLRQAGAAYQFRHAELQQYLAGRPLP